MDALCWRAGARADATSLPSATRRRINAEPHEGADRFLQKLTKHNRLLRSKDFRTVYDTGIRISGPFFAAFCLCQPGADGPRIGFTVPRALGNAVIRNRLRRRFREAVRLRLAQLSNPWSVVFNPRRAAIDCAFVDLEKEISRIFHRCSKQDC